MKGLKDKQKDFQEDIKIARDNAKAIEKMYVEKFKFLNQSLEDMRQKNQSLIEQNVRESEAKNLKINELVKIIEENFGIRPTDKISDSLPNDKLKALEEKVRSLEGMNTKLKNENANFQVEIEDLKTSVRAYRNAIYEKDAKLKILEGKKAEKENSQRNSGRLLSQTEIRSSSPASDFGDANKTGTLVVHSNPSNFFHS